MEFNFIHKNHLQDKELFFGPLTDEDVFIEIENHMIMAHIMVLAKAFPSNGQARKNGWDKPIPKGFTDLRIGKLKTRVTILNEF